MIFKLLLLIFACQFVNGDYWTSWQDNDDPNTGSGDAELIGIGPHPCGTDPVLLIQARTVTGSATSIHSRDLFRVGPAYGVYCPSASCGDYKATYRYLNNGGGTSTSPTYDVNDPGVGGDNEQRYLHGIVANLPATYMKVIRFSSDSSGGITNRRLQLGPLYGLRCVNNIQPGAIQCDDYRVRYKCFS